MKLTTSNFKKDDPVLYISDYDKINNKINHANVGIVTSINDKFVFVCYKNQNHSQATNPENLVHINDNEFLLNILNE